MQNNRPVIGISTSILVNDGWPFSLQERIYVNAEYVRAIEAAGGVPMLLPVVATPEAIVAQVGMLDGLLMSGGVDINPLCYGEEPAQGLEGIYPEVDEHQLALVRVAKQMAKPMLGICRGMQVMNVAFGGTLHQDLASEFADCLRHQQRAKGWVGTHTVDLAAGSKLHEALGETSVLANSQHHQAVKELAPGFVATAATKDGVIEGIEQTDGAFTVAVQWHPEMMAATSPIMTRLFEVFLQKCKK